MSEQTSSPAKRRTSSDNTKRSRPHRLQVVATGGTTVSTQQRVLTVKLEIDWKNADSKALYNRIRDLSWQAARYRNSYIRGRWAEAAGLRVAQDADDHTGVTKFIRRNDKGELGGYAYAAAEREVSAAWTRDGAKILAGRQLPEWKPTSALSVRGHREKARSGVKIEVENNQFVAYLSVLSRNCPDGPVLRVPIARNTKSDDYQAPLLKKMVSWQIPVSKAVVVVKPHKLLLRLSYPKQVVLPGSGFRVATLGPLMPDGRFFLRTETQTRDYTSEIHTIMERKKSWDLIQRRVLARIGRGKGHARAKRRVLSHLSWDNWLETKLHTWSREMVNWLSTQGASLLRIEAAGNGDWPAQKLIHMLTYKGADAGIKVESEADINDISGDRAAGSEIKRIARKVRRRNQAVRELSHQLGETA